MSKRVIELIRVSTEGQAAADRAGIPAQRAANARTAAQHGLNIVRSIQLADVSGANVLLAPEMQELLRLIDSPDVQGVVTREFSRLMRPEKFDDYVILQRFAETNTILYLPEGPIDFASKTGRLMGAIRAAIAGMERTEILERMWSAKEEKRRRGENPQSEITLPFGVGWTRQRGWYFKPEAEKVREAFRLFLAGENSYSKIGHKLGIDPYNLRIILRNPIYSGWRVIDKRRDPSPSAKRSSIGGRQGDRKKISRTADEVIRLHVISEPLVSELEFSRVQQILELKKQNHWRAQANIVPRFTYNGFLKCGACRSTVYTDTRDGGQYVCKNRRVRPSCDTNYMRKGQLEGLLDELFSKRLLDRDFLSEIGNRHMQATATTPTKTNAETIRVELASLSKQRERVLDSYIEGVLNREQRDERLARIESEITVFHSHLLREEPEAMPDAESLARLFAPFLEWNFLAREDKRRLLSAIVPEIHVADYRVHGISLLGCESHGDDVSRRDKDSSPPQA